VFLSAYKVSSILSLVGFLVVMGCGGSIWMSALYVIWNLFDMSERGLEFNTNQVRVFIPFVADICEYKNLLAITWDHGFEEEFKGKEINYCKIPIGIIISEKGLEYSSIRCEYPLNELLEETSEDMKN